MELEVDDVVVVECDSEFGRFNMPEMIISENKDSYITRHLKIKKDFTVGPRTATTFKGKGTFRLLKVWRFDCFYDYSCVYSDIKADEKSCLEIHGPDTPVAVPWSEYNKVLRENTELKEIVVDQVKEIRNLKKEK